MSETTGKLSVGTKLGYGAAELSGSLTWTMVTILYLFFLTDVVRLDPAFAGFILMVGTVWDAFTDPTMGILSDRSRSRFGRRRPFLLAVALPFGLITWLLFTDPGLSPVLTKVYFIAMIVLYYTAATMLDVPYTALLPEMTPDYDERTSLSSYRAVYCQLASLIGASLPWLLVGPLSERLGGVRSGWSAVTAIFGVFVIFPILITWRATRGREIRFEENRIALRDVLRGPLQNRPFLFTLGLFTASNVALCAAAAIMVYFMKYYLLFSEKEHSLAFLFLFACTILWIPAVNLLLKKYGKRTAFLVLIGIWMVVQSAGGFLIKPFMKTAFYLLVIIASGGVITVTITGWALLADVVEVDEFKTGRRREGLYTGVLLFSKKFFVALALWLVGLALDGFGYVPDRVQTPDTLLGIRLLYSQGTALLLGLSLVMAWFLPMTKQKHEALREALRLKKDGKRWNEKSLEGIV